MESDTSKNIHKLIRVIILDIIAIFILTCTVYKVFYKHEHPTFMGYSIATVKSESMLPTLEVNDVVVTKKQDWYRRDDIVIYKVWKIHVVHRIIHSYEEDGVIKYVTKGDNNELRDRKKSTNDNIVGKVIYILPEFGIVIKVVSYTAVVAIVAFSIGFTYDIKKSKQKGKKGKKDVSD